MRFGIEGTLGGEFCFIFGRIWSVFELFILFNSIAASFPAVVTRIIMGFVAGIIALTRIDQPILPDWIIKTLYIDAANKSYLAVVLMYHYHNNPIAITFSRLLCNLTYFL